MTRNYCILAATMLLAVACHRNNPVVPPVPETTTLRLSATMEPLYKAGVESDGSVTWQTGDKIAVLLDNGDVASLTLESGEGTKSATFSGVIPSARKFAGKAAYPWWDGAWSASAGELTLTLPETVDWQGNSYVPVIMKAVASGDSLPFVHEGAVMQFTVKGLPSSVAGFTFSTSGNAVMGRNDFSYTFTPGESTMVFHIPVKTGTLPSYTISLKDISGGVFISKTKSSTTSVERRDFRIVTPLEVKADKRFRVLCYNVLEGMTRDSENNYDNFVAWVRSMAPDVMILCEAGNLEVAAPRWGHPYAAKLSKDSFPIVISSSHPITVEKRIDTDGKVVHGALYVSIDGYNIVGLHLRPTLDDDKSGDLQEEEYAKYGALRKTELEYILSQTLDNAAYSSRTDWIFTGDFNAYSPLEKTAISPFAGKSAYAYSEPTASVCYEVYPLIADRLKDVLYYKGGTAFKPTMYHGRSRLDYIFASDGLYGRVGAADVVLGGFPGNYNDNNVNPSDHMPVYMDLITYIFKVLDGITRLEDWPEEDLISELL